MAFVSFGYGFTVEQQNKIIEVLTPKLRGCPACGKAGTWQLMTDGIVNMPISSPTAYPGTYANAYAGTIAAFYGQQNRTLPCIALTCANCGHLQFHSILQLGLAAALGFTGNAPLLSPEGK